MFDEATNSARAEWARVATDAFAKVTNMDSAGEELSTVIGDLLGDVMHLCKSENIDFQAMLQTAEMHYAAEIEEEKSASVTEARALAKKSASLLDASVDQKITGVSMGCTEHHAVLSLGRTAVIVDFDDFEMVPDHVARGQEVTIEFKDGKGTLDLKAVKKGVER